VAGAAHATMVRTESAVGRTTSRVSAGGHVNLAHIIDDHDADSVALICAVAAPPTGSCATRSIGLSRRPGARSVSRPATGWRCCCRQLAALRRRLPRHRRPGSRHRAAQPHEPRPRTRVRARRGRCQGRRRRQGQRGQLVARRPGVAAVRRDVVRTEAADDPTAQSRSTTCSRRRTARGVVDVDRRSSRCADVHQRHRRRATSGDAHPRQPRANLDQSLSAEGHIDADDVIYGVLPAVPHLRAQRRDRARVACRGHDRARAAVRSVHGRPVDPGPSASRSSPVRRRSGRRSRTSTNCPATPSQRCAWRCPERRGSRSASRETMRDRFGVEIREGYGLTEASPIVTTSTGCAGALRVGRPGAGRVSRSASSTQRRRARRRRRRDLGARRQRLRGLLRRPGGDRRGARPTTAGCEPATWQPPTTTATCTSSIARRTSSSCRDSTCIPAEVEEMLTPTPPCRGGGRRRCPSAHR
jgi:hypothetical protein